MGLFSRKRLTPHVRKGLEELHVVMMDHVATLNEVGPKLQEQVAQKLLRASADITTSTARVIALALSEDGQ